MKLFKLFLLALFVVFGIGTVYANDPDLSAYSAMNLDVYENSRVTKMTGNEDGSFTIEGYMFANASFDKPNSYYREIVFVNENDNSKEYAYRQEVTSVYSTYLNKNLTASNNRKYNLIYANYKVTVDPNSILDYNKTQKTAMKDGNYLVYMRISNGKESYLFPLRDLTLSNGKTLSESGKLPTGFEVKNKETRELRYINTCNQQKTMASYQEELVGKGYIIVEHEDDDAPEAYYKFKRDEYDVYMRSVIVSSNNGYDLSFRGYVVDMKDGFYIGRKDAMDHYGDKWITLKGNVNDFGYYDMRYSDYPYEYDHIYAEAIITPWKYQSSVYEVSNTGTLISQHEYMRILTDMHELSPYKASTRRYETSLRLRMFYDAYMIREYYSKHKDFEESSYIIEAIDDCRFSAEL